MWSLFRVENEHCTNVGRFRASRDAPLPYQIPSSPEVKKRAGQIQRGERVDEEQPAQGETSGAQLHLERTRSTLRQRHQNQEVRPSPLQRAITSVGDMFRDAHAEDFERKKKPELGQDPRNTKVDEEDDTEDDESDGEEESRGDGDVDSEVERDSDGDADMDDEEESAFSRIREDLEIGMSGARSGLHGGVVGKAEQTLRDDGPE